MTSSTLEHPRVVSETQWLASRKELLEKEKLPLVAISRAPLAKLMAFKKRMGWGFKWVSSAGGFVEPTGGYVPAAGARS